MLPGSPALLLLSPLPRLPALPPPLLPALLPLLPSMSRLPPSGESEPTEDNSDWESFRARRCLRKKISRNQLAVIPKAETMLAPSESRTLDCLQVCCCQTRPWWTCWADVPPSQGWTCWGCRAHLPRSGWESRFLWQNIGYSLSTDRRSFVLREGDRR